MTKRKLYISEAFGQGGESTISLRLPSDLYERIEKDSQEQGLTISQHLRELLAYHYLPTFLIEKGLGTGDIGLLESWSLYTDTLRQTVGRLVRRSTAPGEGFLSELLESAVEKQLAKMDFESVWQRVLARSKKKEE